MATYILVVEVAHECGFPIGRMGMTPLRRGLYLYVGSAKRRLPQRIQHHLARHKKRHWHIDYVLDGQNARVREVWAKAADEECFAAAAVARMPEAHVVREKMGSSDCRCPTHFFRLQAPLRQIRDRLRSLSFEPMGVSGSDATVRRGAPFSL
jgi:Uri superfamily endonuclease